MISLLEPLVERQINLEVSEIEGDDSVAAACDGGGETDAVVAVPSLQVIEPLWS